MTFLWVKAFHLFFVVSWFVGLLYLPRLFVYHADCADQPGRERFALMEKRLLKIMMVAMGGAFAFGIWLLSYFSGGGWLVLKLVLVLALVVYHVMCGRYARALAAGSCARSSRFFRWFNEVPAVLLLAIVLLAVVKPF